MLSFPACFTAKRCKYTLIVAFKWITLHLLTFKKISMNSVIYFSGTNKWIPINREIFIENRKSYINDVICDLWIVEKSFADLYLFLKKKNNCDCWMIISVFHFISTKNKVTISLRSNFWKAVTTSPHTHTTKKWKTRTLECSNTVQNWKIPYFKNVETRKSLYTSKIRQ